MLLLLQRATTVAPGIQEKSRGLHLAGNNGGSNRHDKHGPVDRAGNAGVECGGVVLWVHHQVGRLAQVGYHERWVRNKQEAQLQAKQEVLSAVRLICCNYHEQHTSALHHSHHKYLAAQHSAENGALRQELELVFGR